MRLLFVAVELIGVYELLRGRAVQNVLFEGKAQCLEFIQALLLTASPERVLLLLLWS